MKQPVYTIGSYTIGFSLDGIRKKYSKKEDFIKDITKSNENIDKAKLKKVLDKVWKEAFPQEENNNEQEGAE